MGHNGSLPEGQVVRESFAPATTAIDRGVPTDGRHEDRCGRDIAGLHVGSYLRRSAGVAQQADSAGQRPDSSVSAAALKKLSIEQLMDLQVTSVSKRPERLSQTASAIQVITQQDIRRSGASSLAEALRLASNLQVAQVDSRQWAISARGFNGTTANKLLVLIDGRTIYTPLFSGVFWDVQEVPLEDIDRIEVISGPGATLWGANAVNGVINVITKDAKDTQGFLLTGGGGTEQHGFGTVRYGAALGSSVRARIYGRDSIAMRRRSRADKTPPTTGTWSRVGSA